MKSRKITLSVLLLGIMAIIAVALPGCKDKAEKSLAEKMIGRWNTTGSYEKLNGEWVKISGEGDKGWYEFRPDGTVSAYQLNSGQEQKVEMEWSVDEATGNCTLIRDNGKTHPGKVVFENDDRFAIHYTTTFDHSIGQTREGEFKDVQQRER